MKQYEAYRDSGIEWIGEIPEHWNRTALKRIVQSKITDGPHETPEFLDHGVPFVSAEAIKNGTIDFNLKRGFISQQTHSTYSRKCKPQNGDIFIVKSGSTTGKVAFVKTNIEFNIWSPIALIRPLNDFSGRYIFYFCSSECFQKQVQLFWSFGTQPNIGMGVLENLFIAFPGLSEQTAISRFLDHKTAQIDLAIEKGEKLIDLLKEHRAAIINEAVTKGLPAEAGAKAGIDPDVPMKDSGIEWIREIPEHWEVKRFSFLFSLTRGLSITKADLQDKGIPCVSYGEVHSKYGFEVNPQIHPLKCVNEKYIDISKKSLIQNGDFVFADTSEDIEGSGNFTYLNSDALIFAGYHTIIAKPKSSIESRFIAYFFHSLGFRHQIRSKVTGTKVYSITQAILNSSYITLPPINEQKRIFQYIDSQCVCIDEEIQSTQKEIKLLREYRQSLIAEAVTGKIDVRDYPPSCD